MCEWKESHQCSTKDTDDVTDCHHEETSVLPSSSNETSDNEGDDLKGSTSTIEQSGIDGREAQSLDNRPAEVGKDPVGHARTKHGYGCDISKRKSRKFEVAKN